jgi:transglutaminase-like putative cysteine protease
VSVRSRFELSRGALRMLGIAFLALLAAAPAGADGPIAHEYFEPIPEEDLLLQARTASGSMPAAIDTPSGVVRAPDATRNPGASEVVYSGGSTPNSADAAYQVDRDTSRPDRVGYDDPFVPAITPFKRLYAHDAVDERLELVVRDKELSRIDVGGDEIRANEDRFYGDMVVDLNASQPVRIPSVGPGARVLAAYGNPPSKFELLRDGADNWFIRGHERQRMRLVMMLAIERAVFGSEFADVSFAEIGRHLPALPDVVRPAAREVLAEIGVTNAARPREAVGRLVAHFRGFAPSEDRPKSASGVALYKELSLSKKGVCRHRAYAFVITALEAGIPARLVRNEAHAWVEVFDGRLWHLVDLGGAAGRLDYSEQPETQLYRPPTDPYRWPEGSESGQQMVERSMAGIGQQPGDSTGNNPSSAPSPAQSAGSPFNLPVLDAGASPGDTRDRAHFELTVSASEIKRGTPLAVTGRVDADGEACQYARVDIALRSNDGKLVAIGAVPADENGRFNGAVTVPLELDVGDYEVVASTPGDSRCGPGVSE